MSLDVGRKLHAELKEGPALESLNHTTFIPSVSELKEKYESVTKELKACCDAVSFYPTNDELLSEFLKYWVTKNAELTEIKTLKEENELLKLELAKKL